MKRVLACLSCGSMLDREEQERGYCGRCHIPKSGAPPKPPAAPSRAAKPAAPKSEALRKLPASSPPASPPPQAPKKILIIDDEPIIVKLLSSRLQTHGYQVLTAFDGEEGYLMIKTKKPDLILSDILMPKMTGYDLVQRLKKEKDGTEKIPVLIMTAKPSMKDFFSDWEIHSFIAKPLVPEELMKKIADLLEAAELMKRKQK
ncbi:MAG TPA: response regulator [Verrucomicrobiae bacterium]|nr:response regulator [Verrucomicrobiae bacterium]